MLGSEQLDPQVINRRFSRQCKEAANRHFADLVPPRIGEDDLYMHLFRAIYATLAVLFLLPLSAPRQCHPSRPKFMATGRSPRRPTKRRTGPIPPPHCDDYAIADPSGNVDGRRGFRLGEPGAQVLEVLQSISPPPTELVSTAPIPMPTTPAKIPKPAKAKPRHWRISDAAHKILSKDWTLAKDDHQSEVFDRVLAFAAVAKKFSSIVFLACGTPNNQPTCVNESLRKLPCRFSYLCWNSANDGSASGSRESRSLSTKLRIPAAEHLPRVRCSRLWSASVATGAHREGSTASAAFSRTAC
jgi:hypothetical protein